MLKRQAKTKGEARDEKVRGKNAPPYLTEGELLGRNRFRVEAMIGGGGFGQIYTVTSKQQPSVMYAAKVEPQAYDARMLMEIRVLEELNEIGAKNAPKIICSGSANKCNYIVMQRLEQNLSEIRKTFHRHKFSLISTIRIGHQLIEALRELHSIGYVHRDIKPSNICPGIGPYSKVIYLIDYGMARRFRTRETGEWRQERAYVGFRGTIRYASIGAHDRVDQSPTDDLWSLYYTLIELHEGDLPWRRLTDSDEIAYMKSKITYKELCPSFPRQFRRFGQTLYHTYKRADPDYKELHVILELLMPAPYDREAAYEWEMTVASPTKGVRTT